MIETFLCLCSVFKVGALSYPDPDRGPKAAALAANPEPTHTECEPRASRTAAPWLCAFIQTFAQGRGHCPSRAGAREG